MLDITESELSECSCCDRALSISEGRMKKNRQTDLLTFSTPPLRVWYACLTPTHVFLQAAWLLRGVNTTRDFLRTWQRDAPRDIDTFNRKSIDFDFLQVRAPLRTLGHGSNAYNKLRTCKTLDASFSSQLRRTTCCDLQRHSVRDLIDCIVSCQSLNVP